MSALVDFSQARGPLVDAIERTAAGAGTASLREYLAKLPGSNARTVDLVEKLELGAEARALLELAFRTCLDLRVLMQVNLQRAHKDTVEVIGPLLDTTLWASDEGYVEASLPMVLVAELLDSQTLATTEHSFLLLEQRAERIAALCRSPIRSTKLILLRLTVDLLKRLSKTNNAVFNGRVLMWLAYVLPLSERSGLNLKSEANTANVTIYEDSLDQKQMDSVEGPPVDPALYKAFWSLQNYIHNPLLLFKGEHWLAFSKAMETVLTAFATLPVAEGGKGTDELCFTTKYLTSSRLLKLQLKDPTFRRHFLTQAMVLLHALQVPVTKPGPGIVVHVVKDKQRAIVLEFARKVRDLLDKTPPQGSKFNDALAKLMIRESQWVTWKKDGCPALERPAPLTAGAVAAAPAAAVVAPAPAASASASSLGSTSSLAGDAVVALAAAGIGAKRKRADDSARIPLGNRELARLWKLPNNKDAIAKTEGAGMPTLQAFFEPMKEEAEPDAGIEDAYKKKNNRVWMWKAMRLITRQAPNLIGKIKNNDLESLLGPLFGLPEKAAAAADTSAVVDEKATEEEKEAGVAAAKEAEAESQENEEAERKEKEETEQREKEEVAEKKDMEVDATVKVAEEANEEKEKEKADSEMTDAQTEVKKEGSAAVMSPVLMTEVDSPADAPVDVRKEEEESAPVDLM